MDLSKINGTIKNVAIFLAVFLMVNYLMNSCQKKPDVPPANLGPVTIETNKSQYSRYDVVTVTIQNNTTKEIVLPKECPGEPLNVYKFENNAWTAETVTPAMSCSNAQDTIVPVGGKSTISYNNWNHALFAELGRFKIDFKATVDGKEQTFTTTEFTVTEEGIWTKFWRGIFYRPIYNGLIFLTYVLPYHDLGFAILLLTIIIRSILIMPSQKAMKEQKKMQELQPRLNKIKEQYKGDQQKIAQETMALWKEAKVSPFGSCLPILLQFPFLIAVFYSIKDGLNPDNSYLLYTTYSNFGLQDIGVNFLGILDLTKVNLYILPLIVGGLQFIQMKLSMANKAKKDAKAIDKKGEKIEKSEMEMANSMMIYMMPVMIAVFTASVPAGVGMYWGISTTYGIVQQIVVNRSKSPLLPKDPNVNVKVIS